MGEGRPLLTMEFRGYYGSAHLVNCTFDQMHCAADQFISYTVFDELANIWSIAQHFCNRVWVRVRGSFKVRVWVRLEQLAKCAACLIKRAARLVKCQVKSMMFHGRT